MLQKFLPRVTHWQEGLPDLHDAKQALATLQGEPVIGNPVTDLLIEAVALTDKAKAVGLNLTIEQVPNTPLAMGNNEYAFTVWEKRK